MPQFTDQPNIGPINHCYVTGQETDRSLRCRHEGNCLTAYGKKRFSKHSWTPTQGSSSPKKPTHASASSPKGRFLHTAHATDTAIG